MAKNKTNNLWYLINQYNTKTKKSKYDSQDIESFIETYNKIKHVKLKEKKLNEV